MSDRYLKHKYSVQNLLVGFNFPSLVFLFMSDIYDLLKTFYIPFQFVNYIIIF